MLAVSVLSYWFKCCSVPRRAHYIGYDTALMRYRLYWLQRVACSAGTLLQIQSMCCLVRTATAAVLNPVPVFRVGTVGTHTRTHYVSRFSVACFANTLLLPAICTHRLRCRYNMLRTRVACRAGTLFFGQVSVHLSSGLFSWQYVPTINATRTRTYVLPRA